MRKVYWDFIGKKLLSGKLFWLLRKFFQFFLIHFSYWFKKPLTGPILGTFFVTFQCNYHCKMCDLPLRGKELHDKGLRELTTVQLKGVLHDFYKLGVAGVGFTGGEPLLRADIFELLAYAKSLGMITHLNTNSFLIDRNKAKAILESGVDSINISLDGPTAQIHDAIRGFSGAFDKTIAAIDVLNEARQSANKKVRLKTVMVVDDTNIKTIPQMLELTQKLKTDCIEFIPQQPFVDDGKYSFDENFFVVLNDMVEYLHRQKRAGAPIENSHEDLDLFDSAFKRKKFPLKCYAGYNSCAVDCYGEIYPCMPWINWGKPVGNVTRDNIKRFWYSSNYNNMRCVVNACRDCYLNCQAELNILFNRPKRFRCGK